MGAAVPLGFMARPDWRVAPTAPTGALFFTGLAELIEVLPALAGTFCVSAVLPLDSVNVTIAALFRVGCFAALKTLIPCFLASSSLITEAKPPALIRSYIETAIGSSTPARFSLADTEGASDAEVFLAPTREAAVAGLIAAVGLRRPEVFAPTIAVNGLAPVDGPLSAPPVKSTRAAPLDISLLALNTLNFFFCASTSVQRLFKPPRASLCWLVNAIGSLSGTGSLLTILAGALSPALDAAVAGVPTGVGLLSPVDFIKFLLIVGNDLLL